MLANLVGQVGCVAGFAAIIIIGLAFGLGWVVDDWMGNERKFATIIFMLGSFPVTLYVMVQVSLRFVTQANEKVEAIAQEEKKDKDEIEA